MLCLSPVPQRHNDIQHGHTLRSPGTYLPRPRSTVPGYAYGARTPPSRTEDGSAADHSSYQCLFQMNPCGSLCSLPPPAYPSRHNLHGVDEFKDLTKLLYRILGEFERRQVSLHRMHSSSGGSGTHRCSFADRNSAAKRPPHKHKVRGVR